MYFLAILFTLASAAAIPASPPPSKYMPDIEYFLRGYNVMKGNPHQTSVSVVDPGFQEPIFKLSYDQGTTTPDDKYFSPDGTLVTKCESCSLQAVTKKISGMHSYRDSLSEKVKISEGICIWPWCPYRFSWSVDYKKVKSHTSSHSNFYTHSDASCCAYQVQTDLFKPPPFSSDFLRGIITLPENCATPQNKALYRKFIDSFGTNYIKQTDMGSLFGQEIKISKESWKSMMNQSIDIDWSLRWSFFFAWNDIDVKYNETRTKIEKFHKFTSSRSLYTKGSKPPKEGKLSIWVHEAKKHPAPIALELGSMLDLFTSLKVPQPIITCMNESLYNYCDDNICKDLKPDGRFPGSWKRWLTNFNTGQRSKAKFCPPGDYVTHIQLARDDGWFWPVDGLYDLRFKCSTEPHTWRNFTEIAPPWTYWGNNMTCQTNGFKKMSTFETQLLSTYPINVRAQCNQDSQPQYAFVQPPPPPPSEFDEWVTCDAGQKIVGFQVETQVATAWPYTDRIMNFRFACE